MNFIVLMRQGLKQGAGEQIEAEAAEQAEKLRSIPGVVIHRVSPYSATVYFPGDQAQLESLLAGTRWTAVYAREHRTYRLM
ncbi:hypothetical protein [Paraburkholderia youngii]|uniref:hypothetical protein n=1 Tax=Paraburkholderia youngii TaxID=2782701 RepID=UPI003D1DCE47